MNKQAELPPVPLILHNTAPSDNLTWEERVLLRRNRKILENWRFMLWTHSELDKFMKENFSDLYRKYGQITRGIIKSDIGRYAVLYKYGGVYADTDYKFLKYPSELLNSICTLPTEQGQAPRIGQATFDRTFRLGNACLASVPKHRFWLDFMTNILETNTLTDIQEKDPIEMTGPIAMTQFLLANMDNYSDIDTPCSTKYLPDLTWSRMGIARSKESVGIHMCWGSWRNRKSFHHYRTVVRRKLTCLI